MFLKNVFKRDLEVDNDVVRLFCFFSPSGKAFQFIKNFMYSEVRHNLTASCGPLL